MKAMILAAGLGKRLRPLTNDRPKALVEVNGRTLLEITLTRLSRFGIREVIINVHHFADMIVDYLRANNSFGMHIETSREEVLLDTGGGLKKAAWFFLKGGAALDEPFVLHNVDVISAIDLQKMAEAHPARGGLATLAVQERKSSRYLLFDKQLHLCGRQKESEESREIARGECPELRPLAFSGIHIISPRLLSMIQRDGVFSIIDVYLQLVAEGQNIAGYRADGDYWRDLGKLEQVQLAAEDFRQKLIL
ncbi:MAG TPA: nucleotidyltransferase family protein [Candidatus Acidoferrum sp.]|nr:nucleotidyltransferase family protein [Candidatus Acidoferrum sp.]